MDDNFSYFMHVVESLATSQGFYSRIVNHVYSLNEYELQSVKDYINQYTFKNPLDVICFLEA